MGEDAEGNEELGSGDEEYEEETDASKTKNTSKSQPPFWFVVNVFVYIIFLFILNIKILIFILRRGFFIQYNILGQIIYRSRDVYSICRCSGRMLEAFKR
jgi:hypothetical protein